MSANFSPTAEYSEDEIVLLVARLHETQQRLQELAGGQVDAVLHPGGQSYMLHEAQEKLRQSEASQNALAMMQSSILNALPAHIALIDREGVIISVNEGWRRFAGGNALEGSHAGLGLNYLDICERAEGPCAEDARRAAAGIRTVLSNSAAQFAMEYPCHSPVEQRWFRLMASPIGDSSKGGAVVMHVDITARRLAEDAVRESEERFRGLFSAAATGIAVSTPEGRYLQANGAYCRMLGYTEEELKTLTFASLTHPGDLHLNVKLRDELLAGRRDNFVIEKRYIKKNRDTVWSRVSVSATRGPLGEPKTLIVVSEDITEQKMAAEEVRRSAALLSMASRVGRTGAWVVDLPSMALTWSAGTRAIHEVPPDYAPTIDASINFCAPEHRDTLRAAMNGCMQNGAPFDLEFPVVTARGRGIWVRAIGERVRSAGGAGTGVNTRIQGAYQDITDRKAGEEELTRMNRALKTLSSCNEALIRAETEQGLLDEICRIAVEHGGYRMAWVGFARDDEAKRITPEAHAGAEDGYLSEIQVTWNENDPAGMGLGGRAIRTGQTAVCEDMATDSSFSNWSDLALRHGYRSGIALPLRDASRTFGILGLLSAEEKSTSAEELKLLQQLADDLAFGILNLRAREQKRRVETVVLKVASSASAASGTEFFEHLAQNMAEALGAQAGFVARMLRGEPPKARTIAGVIEGRIQDHFDYSLGGTPCEVLTEKETCIIAKEAVRQYPEAGTIAALHAEGYAGRRLSSSTGEPLGLLCVIFRNQIEHVDFVSSTLQIFAARAASELERQEAEARLRDQARLLDIAHDAIHVNDLDNYITYWNKGAERIYGWNAGEALGRLSHEMLHQDDTDSLKAVKALLAQGEWKGETSKRTKDGRDIIVDMHWTLVRDARGKPKSILAIDTDITERKRLEEQFLRAQRLESIGTLASGLAHDLNNILAPIMMCAPILRGNLRPEEKEKIVGAIESSASRGAKIISQVLTFGRGVHGERKPMQIEKIIREIKQVADETFPKNVRIETIIAPGLSQIVGDATQWHQVLMNLCVNARDAMPDGGSLRVTAENLAVDAHYASMTTGLKIGPHIAIEVADSGSGIPPEVAERIFDPFFTTKPVGKGTGLGLSTVLGIVKSHGGVINLTSRPGMGTTFRIVIPSDDSEAAATGEPAAPPAGGHGEMILIADDEENVRAAARTVLELNGYRTLCAGDGIEALALYAQHATGIDAVLTDITMPFMDGIALMQALRRMRPALPMIASTGQEERFQELKMLGLATTLTKPYTATLLLNAVNAALKAAREKAAR